MSDVLATQTGRLLLADGSSHLLLVAQSGPVVPDVPADVTVRVTQKAAVIITLVERV